MFTGIVRHVGRVQAVRNSQAGKVFVIDIGPLAEGLQTGDSVAVSGVCLTATAIAGRNVEFDVVRETLSRSTLERFAVGQKVNLELAMTLGQRLDGHLVQGHVDGIAGVKQIRRDQQYVIEFTAEPALTDLMVAKGSVAVDGVSLTLVQVKPEMFSVAVIPTTLGLTTLGDLKGGDKVNIETDIIGKYVAKWSKGLHSGLGLKKLQDEGFI